MTATSCTNPDCRRTGAARRIARAARRWAPSHLTSADLTAVLLQLSFESETEAGAALLAHAAEHVHEEAPRA